MPIFISTVLNENEGPFMTFSEALKNFWPRFRALVEGGCPAPGLSWCWIEAKFDPGDGVPLLWESVNNFGIEHGLFTEKGELKDPLPEIRPELVSAAFRQSRLDRISWMINGALPVREHVD